MVSLFFLDLVWKWLVYIVLGSNLGDCIGWIEKVCVELDVWGIKVKCISSLWEMEFMYVLDQDRFVNGVCEVCLVFDFCYINQSCN